MKYLAVPLHWQPAKQAWGSGAKAPASQLSAAHAAKRTIAKRLLMEHHMRCARARIQRGARLGNCAGQRGATRDRERPLSKNHSWVSLPANGVGATRTDLKRAICTWPAGAPRDFFTSPARHT